MHRSERTADVLKEEIAQIVGYELEDPRLTMVTVTDVRLSADRRDQGVPVVNHPRTPEIHFVRDRVEEEGERVDQLLQEIEREWESQGKETDT